MENYADFAHTASGSRTISPGPTIPAAAGSPIDQLWAIAAERKRRKQQAMAPPPIQGGVVSYGPPQQAAAIERRPTPTGQPRYVKLMTGPGVTPGYMPTTAMDPGAIFGGYAPADGYMPNNSYFQR